MKVAVLGAAGGIGQALSLLLKTQLPAGSELALYDVAPVVPGVAVDLSHIPTAVKVTGHGKDDLAGALTGTDVVDHLRMMTLESSEGQLYLSEEYAKQSDENIQKMLNEASK